MMFPYEQTTRSNKTPINDDVLEKTIATFKRQQVTGAFSGGQMVVRRHGNVILNESIGSTKNHQLGNSSLMKVTPETLFSVYSTGKPLAAVVIALMEERGLLNVDMPIAKIISEFGQHGKENITIYDVLTHTAGILLPELYKDNRIDEHEYVLSCLSSAQPLYKRGTFAYTPIEYGVLLCEITRRLTQQTLTDFFKNEIATPLQLNQLKFGLDESDIDHLAYNYWLGKDKVMINGYNIAEEFETKNNTFDVLKTRRNPAFNMISNAANLAAFYEFLLKGGVTPTGQQLISEKIVRRYTTLAVSGWNKNLKTYLAMGQGFMVGTLLPSPFGWWNTQQCFGHAGMFSSIAFGDYKTGTAAAIITNGNRGIGDFFKRFLPLCSLIRKL